MDLHQLKACAARNWRQYEAGKEYHRKIDLYRTAAENERFYRGEQWSSPPPGNLPAPIFNYVKRIADYMCSAVCEAPLTVRYTDESLPLRPQCPATEYLTQGLELLNRAVAYRFEKNKMDALIRAAAQDAILCGDAVFYTYWDPEIRTGQAYAGDFVTVLTDSENFFVADVNNPELQQQDYLLLAGRTTVRALREEATQHGAAEEILSLIRADAAASTDGTAPWTDTDCEAERVTYLLKLYRRPDGQISFEKSVRDVLLYRVDTPLRRYPVAIFRWDTVKHSYHGCSPITSMIANQKYLNKAYAMVMKHMADTAFSKVIYDKKLIPEWSNEVGQAIGVVSGGNVENAVKTVGVGQMQAEYLEVIRMASEQTRLIYGATDTALGESVPQNSSALLAMRDASRLPLQQVQARLYQCVEELACIWAEMICAYYGDGRAVLLWQDGQTVTAGYDFSCLRDALLRARVEVGHTPAFDATELTALLFRLLEAGHITFEQYLSRLPDGVLPDRNALLEEQRKKKEVPSA